MKNYEISLWNDIKAADSYAEVAEGAIVECGHSYYTKQGDNYILCTNLTVGEEFPTGTYYEKTSSYTEEKIAIIGADGMDAQWRAVEPKLVSNVNGKHTFSFKMYYTYINTKTGEKEENPFKSLMTNERKIKVHDISKDKWYHLVIKNIQENSSDKSFTYTCEDQFIDELSKNGFSLTFDNELNNNMGTADELGTKVLEGTDWSIETGETIQQRKEENLYELSGNDIKAQPIVEESSLITMNKIFLFYSNIEEKSDSITFYGWNQTGTPLYDPSTMIIDESTEDLHLYHANNISWSYDSESDPTYYIIKQNTIEIFRFEIARGISNLKAKYLYRSQETKLDSILGRTVFKYTKDNENYWEYTETEYASPLSTYNLVSNNKDFTDTNGWRSISGNTETGLTFVTRGTIGENTYLGSYIYVNDTIRNTGIVSNISYLSNGFQEGEKYIFRLRGAKNDNADDTRATLPTDLSASDISSIRVFYIDDNEISHNIFYSNSGSNYLRKTEDASGKEIGITTYYTSGSDRCVRWIEFYPTCLLTLTKKEILSLSPKIEIIFANVEKGYLLREAQFFKRVDTSDGFLDPSQLNYETVIQKYYCYYKESDAQQWKSAEDYKLAYKDTTKWTEATPVYYSDYRKVRSISEKGSNRFNLIQKIAETFECWAIFSIEQDSTGKISSNGKKIKFMPEVGEEIPYGFIYGIDLKQTSRTLASNQITSKIIVQDNSNEYATDGYCSIARSTLNYPKTNFILNFDYYINNGLLDGAEVFKDLYSNVPSEIGYYFNYAKYNANLNSYVERLSSLKTQLTQTEALLSVYQAKETAAEEEKASLLTQVRQLSYQTEDVEDEATIISNARTFKNETSGCDSLIDALAAYDAVAVSLPSLTQSIARAEEGIETLNETIEDLEEEQETIVKRLKELDLVFYKKYSRFIHEGSWISEDYYDDNQYYLDATSTLYTSSRPQVTYNISVVRLSELEKFKDKVFNLGDISWIEDTEFFGYQTDSITPYKEKIIVSEITEWFDSPEKDEIKVQNYKTQYEDLFQRITATSQQVQFATGTYNRASSIVNTDGTIDAETLSSSIALNSDIVMSAVNESVITDNTGVTTIDLSNTNYRTKLTSRGLMISSDGGATWKTAIRGNGINADYLTTGTINTGKIQIMSGDDATFRWDNYGINAYAYTLDSTGKISQISKNKFVRYDQYGIYGYSGNDTTAPYFTSEDEIYEKAKFGLTWNRFFMKDSNSNGSIEISTDNHIRILKGTNELIKIGKFEDDYYGIRIKDTDNNDVFKTGTDGKLYISGQIRIGEEGSNTVLIGPSGNNIVFNSNNNFKIYNDGSISATAGLVGGFSITSEGISSNGIVLNNNGTFSLGELLTFSNGDLTIVGNITANSGTIGGFTINDNKLISNQIILDGKNSILQGSTWYINEKEASFSNVKVSGTIETSVFKKGQISSISGKMIFRPSSRIIGIDNTGLTTKIQIEDSDLDLVENDNILVCTSNDNYEKIVSDYRTLQSGETWITLTTKIENDNSLETGTVVLMNDFIIGINSEKETALNLPKRSLSMAVKENGAYTEKLILGDLSTLPNKEGYGLYCDNVYLNGEIVSEIIRSGESYSTGINTNSTIKSAISAWNEENIIIWGGGPNSSIANSKFYVTDNGHMYASDGYFSGTVEAATLKAAVLEGTGTSPGLYVKDNSNGIVFQGKSDSTYTDVLTINKDGLSAGSNSTINMNSSTKFAESAEIQYGLTMTLQKAGTGYNLYVK